MSAHSQAQPGQNKDLALLDLLLKSIYFYCYGLEHKSLIVTQYRNHWMIKDNLFMQWVKNETQNMESEESLKFIVQKKKDYLGVSTFPPDLSSAEPLWIQKITYCQYGDSWLEPEHRLAVSKEIQQMTDLDVMLANLQLEGGGRGRSPVGSYSELVSRFASRKIESRKILTDSQIEEHQAKMVLIRIWDVYAQIKSLSGTIQNHTSSEPGLSRSISFSVYLEPFEVLVDRLQAKDKPVVIQEVSPKKDTSTWRKMFRPRRLSLSSMTEAVSVDTEEILRNIEHMKKDLARSLKALAKSCKELRLTLVVKMNARLDILRHFVSDGHMFEQIGEHLRSRMSPFHKKQELLLVLRSIVDNDLQDICATPESLAEHKEAASSLERYILSLENPLLHSEYGKIKDVLDKFFIKYQEIMGYFEKGEITSYQVRDLGHLLDATSSSFEKLHELVDVCESVRDFRRVWADFYLCVSKMEKELRDVSCLELLVSLAILRV